MAAINGSIILLDSNGTEIAAQKGLTLNVNRNLFSTTVKQSLGFDTHGNGLRSSDVSFDALYSTTGLSGKELYDLIVSQKSSMLVIHGFPSPYIMEVDMSSLGINAPQEDAVSLSGSFKANGKIYRLDAGNPNQLTGWMQGVSFQYDTLDTNSGTAIPSAIDAGAGAAAESVPNKPISNGETHLVFFYLTVNSGQIPTLKMKGMGSGGWLQFPDAPAALVQGFNARKFTFTTIPTGSDANCRLILSNSNATNFKVSNVYWFKKI